MKKKITIKNLVIVTLLTIGTFSCVNEPKFFPSDTNTDAKKDTDTAKDVDKLDATGDVVQTECAPACEAGTVCKTDGFTCVACLADTDCNGTQVCNSDLNTCVDCKDNSLCTEAAASTCTAGTCGMCLVDQDCSHITGLPRCDSGECKVACENDTHCGGTEVCDLRPNEATYQTCAPKGAVLTQCLGCISDSQCDTGFHCVPLTYGDPAVDQGYYCLEISQNANCVKPWEGFVTDKTSLGGETGSVYCGVVETLTTCEAVLAGRAGTVCKDANTDTADIAKCPIQDGGALCEKNIGMKWVCTYSCGGDNQCQATCNAGNFCD